MRPYVITTPCLNEIEALPRLLADLERQDHPAALWLVVDDGSDDGTRAWLAEQSATRPWMEWRDSPEAADEYLGAHIARIKRWGLEQALAVADDRGLEVFAAGVLDADLGLPADHYARLIGALEADDALGVVSSVMGSEAGGAGPKERFQRADLPRGATQTFRTSCLEAIGGLPPYPGYDGAANVKAAVRGWRCAALTDVVASHARPTATRFGAATGYSRKGRYAWFLGHHPLLIAARTAAYTVTTPHSGGVHFLRGWLVSAARRDARCPDPDVRHHYGHERPRQYLRGILGRGPRWARD